MIRIEVAPLVREVTLKYQTNYEIAKVRGWNQVIIQGGLEIPCSFEAYYIFFFLIQSWRGFRS